MSLSPFSRAPIRRVPYFFLTTGLSIGASFTRSIVSASSPDDRMWVLLAVAALLIPCWVGLILRRMRDIGWPLWWSGAVFGSYFAITFVHQIFRDPLVEQVSALSPFIYIGCLLALYVVPGKAARAQRSARKAENAAAASGSA